MNELTIWESIIVSVSFIVVITIIFCISYRMGVKSYEEYREKWKDPKNYD